MFYNFSNYLMLLQGLILLLFRLSHLEKLKTTMMNAIPLPKTKSVSFTCRNKWRIARRHLSDKSCNALLKGMVASSKCPMASESSHPSWTVY